MATTVDTKKVDEDKINYMTTVISVLESVLSRQALVKDNVTKHLLFLDKLCLSLDVAMAMLSMQLKDTNPELKDRGVKIADQIKKEIESLIEWIQNPVYGPDHPFGHKLMVEDKKHFVELDAKKKEESSEDSNGEKKEDSNEE